jgi:transcriptional regulator with XRE-family HTH domain
MRVNDFRKEDLQRSSYNRPTMPKGTPVSNKNSFGQRLISFRRARGITQIQLAKAARVTQRAISYYETDTGYPPAPVVAQLAQALKISADELLGIKPPPREVSKFEELHGDAESRRLWKRFQLMTSLPDRDQRAVIRLINSLSSARGSEARA